MSPRLANIRHRCLGPRAAWLLAALLLGLSGARPALASGPPEMDPEAIRRISEEWRDRILLVVADGGACRVDVEQVVKDPRALYRKRRVGCALYIGKGRLLTTVSVVGSGREVELFTEQGKHALARVIGVDPYLDLALLEAERGFADMPEPTPLSVMQEPRAGMPCLVLGSAYGRSLSVTLGRLGGTMEIEPGGIPVRVHRVLAPIYPGDSGGLVVDGEGRFAGIVTGVSDPRQSPVLDTFGEINLRDASAPAGSVGFAVPARECARAWGDLASYGRVRRGLLGIQIQAGADERGGVRVLQVTANGPAARGGIRPGDIITTFGDVFVSSGKQLCALVVSSAPSEQVDVTLRRDDHEMHLTVEIGRATELPGVRHLPLTSVGVSR